jgi:hypothetical protein
MLPEIAARLRQEPAIDRVSFVPWCDSELPINWPTALSSTSIIEKAPRPGLGEIDLVNRLRD